MNGWAEVEAFTRANHDLLAELGLTSEARIATPAAAGSAEGKTVYRVSPATPAKGGLAIALSAHAEQPCLTITHVATGRAIGQPDRCGRGVRLAVTKRGVEVLTRARDRLLAANLNPGGTPIVWINAFPFAAIADASARQRIAVVASLQLITDLVLAAHPADLVLKPADDAWGTDAELERRASFFAELEAEIQGRDGWASTADLVLSVAGSGALPEDLRAVGREFNATCTMLGWLRDAVDAGLVDYAAPGLDYPRQDRHDAFAELEAGAWVLAPSSNPLLTRIP